MWYDAKGHNRITAKWRERNIERVRKSNREYANKKYRDNRDTMRTAQNTYYHSREKFLRRERVYGLTPEQHKTLLEQQNHACAICARKVPLDVDHDHKTDKVRGLLCRRCNIAIGQFEDNPELLEKVVSYLRGR